MLVVGGATGLGAELALGLADHGARVVVATPDADRADAARMALGEAGATLGRVDAVVDALADPEALVPTSIAELDDAAWERRCEAALRAALACAQAAFVLLRAHGGRLILVTPTVGITGGAGLAPFAAAVEGRRGLAKSAARQWGRHGITVNCVAPPVALLAPGAADPAIEAPALGRLPDGRADVAPVVAMLVADPGHFVTGATVTVDGGVVMAP